MSDNSAMKGVLDGLKDKMKPKEESSMPSKLYANDGTSIPSSENTNTETKDNTILESSQETSKESKSETILSTNIKSKTVSIEKRLKYLDKKEHRSYYIDKDIIKQIDKVNKKFNIDKSDIVNEALKLLFETLKI